jgi:hypothetical protein
MTAVDCLQKLYARGVRLSIEADALKYEAPRGAITPELREAVAMNRAQIMRLLTKGEPSNRIPEPLPIDVIERCFNGNCPALLEFKQGRAFCPRCGVHQQIVS